MKTSTWGEVARLHYGKALRDYPAERTDESPFRVFGTNGPIGWTSEPLRSSAGIVVGRKGAYRGIHFSPEPFFVIDTAFHLELTSPELDLRWAYYNLLTVDINSMDVGSAIPTTNRDQFHSLKLRYPPLDTQKQIADTLTAYDDLMENNRRRMALLEESARLLYRDWFVHLRFPGHEHTRLINGVPQGWERVPLESALVLQRGFDLPSQDRQEGDVPIYGSTGISGYHDKAKVTAPGVVTGRSGTLGEVHIAREDFWPLNTALWVKEFRRVSPLFALFMLRSLDLKQYNGGSSVPTLDRKSVHKIEVLLPPEKLIQSFDDLATSLFQQVGNLSQQNSKLRTARDLLLPRLMSEEIETL